MAVDYKLETRPDKVAGAEASTRRPADWKAVEDLLLLLARAVQQFHTYPPTSPLCVSAIEACQRALAALDGRDALAFRVAPSELIVDERPLGRGTQVEHELAQRLHRASVAEIGIDRAASARELSRLCLDLLRTRDRGADDATLQERLAEHGADRIAVRMAHRPEVLDVGAPSTAAAHAVARERARREGQRPGEGAFQHLYPPDKGWVRLDPSCPLRTISLVDLALLVEEPAELAAMLLRLTDDEPAGEGSAAALEQKYSDVAMLFASLDPRLSRRMFAKLAHAVLDLDSDRRQGLLRRTILPGLLDGRADGAVLRDFPDIELADSLCLLLDLETAAPELLTTALARLDLPAERQAAMVPLLDARLEAQEAARPSEARRETTLARHARELLRVDTESAKSFAEFAAFDLALDTETRATLDRIGEAVVEVDTLADQLACLWNLVRLEPNPDVVQRFLGRAFGMLAGLDRGSRGAELATWLGRYRALADRFRTARPDVAEAIEGRLAEVGTPDLAGRIVDLHAGGDQGRALAGALVEALGPAIVAPLVGLMEREHAGRSNGHRRTGARAIADLLCDHAGRLAPGMVPFLGDEHPFVRRALVRALGAAGAGYEQAIASQIGSADEVTGREALRSLARIGTPEAAALVAAEVECQRAGAAAAEETLWRLPRPEAERQIANLLAHRGFALRHPQAAARLLDRAAQVGAVGGLDPVLRQLAPLRFRFWNPALARVARKAHALLDR